MRPIDIRDLALNVADTIHRMHNRNGPPILIADGDQPLAVMIRHQVYAPRLNDYEIRQDGDLTCTRCTINRTVIVPNPYNLGSATEAANRHWRDTHQGAK